MGDFMPAELNKENFEAETAKGAVVVDFWAAWCGPCRMLGPVFEELGGEMEKVKFAKVDITQNEEIAQKFNVMSIPTIILFRDGKEVDRMMGAVPKDALSSLWGYECKHSANDNRTRLKLSTEHF